MSSLKPRRNATNNIVTVNTNNNNMQSSDIILDVEQWLKEAKLEKYHSKFIDEDISIEELVDLTEQELISVAMETLKLDTLHRNRFLKAMQKTKNNLTLSRSTPDLQKYANGASITSNTSSNSSQSKSNVATMSQHIIRPSSPANSLHSNKSAPTNISRNNNNNLNGGSQFGFNNNMNMNKSKINSTQSPPFKLSNKHHSAHSYYPRPTSSTHILPSIPSSNNVDINDTSSADNILDGLNHVNQPRVYHKSKPRNTRFSKRRKRRNSEPQKDIIDNMNNIPLPNIGQLMVNKSTPNSVHGSSSNNSIDDTLSMESSEYQNDSAPHSVHSANSRTNNPMTASSKTSHRPSINDRNSNGNSNNNKFKRDKIRSNSTVSMVNKKNKKLNKRKLSKRDRDREDRERERNRRDRKRKSSRESVSFLASKNRNNQNLDIPSKSDNEPSIGKRSKTYDNSQIANSSNKSKSSSASSSTTSSNASSQRGQNRTFRITRTKTSLKNNHNHLGFGGSATPKFEPQFGRPRTAPMLKLNATNNDRDGKFNNNNNNNNNRNNGLSMKQNQSPSQNSHISNTSKTTNISGIGSNHSISFRDSLSAPPKKYILSHSEDEPDDDSENDVNRHSSATTTTIQTAGNGSNAMTNNSVRKYGIISSDEDDEEDQEIQSSDNDNHSEDEKWDELQSSKRNMTKKEKQNMKTISVLLQENKADTNQIEQGMKILVNNYSECKRKMQEYFKDLQKRLDEKSREMMETLDDIKNEKEKNLNGKLKKLCRHKQHVMVQKNLCDKLFEDDNIDIEQREDKIAQYKDRALMKPQFNDLHGFHGSDFENEIDINQDNDTMTMDDDIHDFDERFESNIEIDFNLKQTNKFYNNIMVIKQCTIPHAPKIKVKMRTFTSISLKIVIMNTKEKKLIQHSPFSNQAKNNRIQEIQIEIIQSKSSDMKHINAEFDKLCEQYMESMDDFKQREDDHNFDDRFYTKRGGNSSSSSSSTNSSGSPTTGLIYGGRQPSITSMTSSSPSRSTLRRRKKLRVKDKSHKKKNNKRRKSRKDSNNDHDSENDDSDHDQHQHEKQNQNHIHQYEAKEEEKLITRNGSKSSHSYSYSFDTDNNNSNNNNNDSKNPNINKRRMQRIIIDQAAKLKRIHEISIEELLTGHYCYIRARTKNINGWSAYCEIMDAQLPMQQELKFDIENSSNSNGVSFMSDNKCVVFENNETHNMAVVDSIIDKDEYDTFKWKYIVDFDNNDDEQDILTNGGVNGKSKKHKKHKDSNVIKEGLCIGFIAYPLDKNMTSLNSILGSNGTQYGLRILNNNKSAHIYFTRDGSMHHTCAITLNQTVSNGDIFMIDLNMKKNKCDIYHNNHMLMDIFTSQQIPNKIIPAVSGYINKGKASATIQFVSST